MTFSIWMFALYAGAASSTCVNDFKYPAQLTLPTLEHWSSDHLYKRGTPESECRLVKSIGGLYHYLERRALDDQIVSARPRATWAKGVCFAGTFKRRYDPKLTEARRALLRRAEFMADAEPKPAHLRFANHSGHVRPDWEADLRGLSLSLGLKPDRRQDFALQNVPHAQFGDLTKLERSLQVRRGILSGRIDTERGEPVFGSVYEYFRNLHGTLIAARDARRFRTAAAAAARDEGYHDSYLTQVYFSPASFALGDSNRDLAPLARVVRFGAAPCREHRTRLITESEARAASRWRGRERPNYLGDDARAAVGLGPGCFNLFATFLNEDPTVTAGGERRATEMIENAALDWASPNYAIGELTIDRSVSDAECEAPERDIDLIDNQVGVVPVGAWGRGGGAR